MGNNPMVGATVAIAVAIEEACNCKSSTYKVIEIKIMLKTF